MVRPWCFGIHHWIDNTHQEMSLSHHFMWSKDHKRVNRSELHPAASIKTWSHTCVLTCVYIELVNIFQIFQIIISRDVTSKPTSGSRLMAWRLSGRLLWPATRHFRSVGSRAGTIGAVAAGSIGSIALAGLDSGLEPMPKMGRVSNSCYTCENLWLQVILPGASPFLTPWGYVLNTTHPSGSHCERPLSRKAQMQSILHVAHVPVLKTQ